jgi:serine protease
MRKLFVFCLFCLGIGLAIFNFQGLANQGEFDSLVIDFKENISATEIDRQLQVLRGQYPKQNIYILLKAIAYY